jgi:hypothetical protein
MTDEQRLTSLNEHPSAGPSIRRARGLGGILGFVVAGLIAYENGLPFPSVIERALAVGLACQVVFWAAAVLIWKRLLIAQAAGFARLHAQRASGGAPE